MTDTTKTITPKDAIGQLLAKAVAAENPDACMKYSQAALNAANAQWSPENSAPDASSK